MTGAAMRMRIEVAQLMRRHQAAPKPFSPAALLPAIDHDVIVEGYAASATTIDREFTKFGPHCWMPFRQNIPLLFRHGRPAGVVQEVRSTDKGLYVRALATDPEARRCSHFSIAATIHGFMLRDIDDRERFHALVTCATLDEVSLTPSPCNPEAKILHRYQPSAAVEMYDIAQRWTSCVRGIVEALRVINAAKAGATQSTAAPTRTAPRVDRRTAPVVQRPRTGFGNLVRQMEANHANQGSCS